jgi:hypothetical protein
MAAIEPYVDVSVCVCRECKFLAKPMNTPPFVLVVQLLCYPLIRIESLALTTIITYLRKFCCQAPLVGLFQPLLHVESPQGHPRAADARPLPRH